MKELQEKATPGEAAPVLEFDKDDVDTLDFVTATANLRAHVFGIQQKSKFDTKRELADSNELDEALTLRRDGWQHHSCDRDNKCNDSWYLCPTGVQGAPERSSTC